MEQKDIEYNVELRKILQLLAMYREVSYAQARWQVTTVNKAQLQLQTDNAIESIEEVGWLVAS